MVYRFAIATSIHSVREGASHGVPRDRGEERPLPGELLKQQRQPSLVILRHALSNQARDTHQLGTTTNYINFFGSDYTQQIQILRWSILGFQASASTCAYRYITASKYLIQYFFWLKTHSMQNNDKDSRKLNAV